MLPTLSRLSVSIGPGRRLRHRCSSQYLRISPLHWEFHDPLPNSSLPVLSAAPRLSPGISRLTKQTPTRPLRPVIPSNASPLRITAAAGTKLAGLLLRVPSSSSPPKGLYNPKTFFIHAALLDQACAHCPIFPTAASRRSLGRVSVPVWLIILSDQLPIVALVGRYPTN